jgi:hypothetical protein
VFPGPSHKTLTWGQFHQYAYTKLLRLKMQKHKKESQAISLFALLGSAQAKAAHETLVKLTQKGVTSLMQ